MHRITVINFNKWRNERITVFPHVGALKIPDTITYKVENLDTDSIDSFLSSIGEGFLFGIESLISKGKCVTNFFTSEEGNELQLQRTQPILLANGKHSLMDMDLYYIDSQKASLFPYKMDFSSSILSEIQKQLQKVITEEKVFIQVMFQKINDNWKEHVEKQYESYLNGLEHPSSNKQIHKLQNKILEYTDKLEGWRVRNPEIQAVEQKLSETGYRALIRCGIYNNKTKKDRIIKEILKCFRKMDYKNSWSYTPVIRKHSFIENAQMRRFPLLHMKYQVLSQSEILPLLRVKLFENEVVEEVKLEKQATESVKPKIDTKEIYPLIRLLPKYKDQQEQSDMRYEEKLNQVFKKLDIVKDENVKVTKIQDGATLKKVTIKLPISIRLTAITKAQKDIETELGVKNTQIKQGDEPSTVALLLPQETRKKIYIRNLADTPSFKQFAQEHPLPFIVGVDEVGEPIYECLARVKHLMVAGATGSGKSIWLNQFLVTLLVVKTPQDVIIYIIDPKFVEFVSFNGFPHVRKIINEPEIAFDLLKSIIVEMEERYKKFAKVGVKNIAQYNKKNTTNPLPYIVLLIDEFADLIMLLGTIKELITRIGQKARAAGIHMVLSTQRPEVKIVDGLIKANIPSRIVFAFTSQHDYRTVLDRQPPKLLGNGDGIALLEGKQDLIRFQGALIADSEDETDAVIEKLKKSWQGEIIDVESYELPETEEEKVETDLDRLKRIICETGETRIAHLQKEMKIRMNKIKDLMDELVKIGWIEPPKTRSQGYTLLITEQERLEYLSQSGK